MCNISKDEISYPLRSIYFYPTESCNLRCIHCWLRPSFTTNEKSYQVQNQENISVEIMEQVVKDVLPLGLSSIKFTGGEPFLNPDIFEYLDRFSQYDLLFGFETNGTLLTKKMVKKLKRYNITLFAVSLDGSVSYIHERIRGVKGSFDRTLNGIQLLIENKIYPQIIFCLQKINANDLENTLRLAYELKVKSFEINPLILLGGESLKNQGCEALPLEELLDLERRIEGEFVSLYPDMLIDLYLPPALKGIKDISKHSLCKCNILNICGILSNGDVSICGIGKRKKSLIIGNVKEKGIAAIWKEGALFKEIRKKIPLQMNGICGRCLFKYQCLGFCRAEVLFNDRSLTDPYRICDEVFQKGLFPESRILGEREASLILQSGNEGVHDVRFEK
ncbi:MAG: radical SAM protein [bacterium]